MKNINELFTVKKLLSLVLVLVFVMSVLSSCGEKNKQLVVYTNSGSNGRQEFLQEYAKENGFDISIVTAGGTDISNRLASEASKPIADVVFGLNAIEYEKLKKLDLFDKYSPSWANDVPEGLSDPEGYYNAITMTPLVAVYNPEKTPAVPTDWVDLATNPVFKGKYTVLGLGGGTSKAVFASIVSRYRDDSGELKISDEGWKVVEQYFGNCHYEQKGEDWYGKMLDGSVPVTMIWASGAIERGKEFNFDYGVMSPEIGVPTVVEQLAILKGSKNKEEAQKFVDWLGSAEVQAKWAEKYGTIPVLPEALEKAPQESKDLLNKVKVQQMDWGFIAENIDSWVEKATLEYVK